MKRQLGERAWSKEMKIDRVHDLPSVPLDFTRISGDDIEQIKNAKKASMKMDAKASS